MLERRPLVGGACVKQGLQPNYAHTWRWNTQKPMWQSLEENDPWVVSGGLTVAQVSFAPKFHDNPAAHTLVVVPGGESAANAALPPALMESRGPAVAWRIGHAIPGWAWLLVLIVPPPRKYG